MVGSTGSVFDALWHAFTLAETDVDVAPSLTATAKKLERNLVQNHVAHLLETRPDKDELVTQHILEGTFLVYAV
jgi:hypothetical protein